MALNFPNSPADGEKTTQPNGVTYQWSAGMSRWNAVSTPFDSADKFNNYLPGLLDTGFTELFSGNIDTDLLFNSRYRISGPAGTLPADYNTSNQGFLNGQWHNSTLGMQILWGRTAGNQWKMWMRHYSTGWGDWKLVANNKTSNLWTPELSDSGAGDATLTIAWGRYLRVGQQVTIWGKIAASSLGALTGTARIQNLPFNCITETNAVFGFNFTRGSGFNLAAGFSVTGSMTSGNEHFILRRWNVIDGEASLTDNHLTDLVAFEFNGSYLTDDT